MLIQFKSKLPTIVSVEAFPEDGFGITLSNRHTVWLSLADRAKELEFVKLRERGIYHNPQTDGKRLYWEDGPEIGLEEILNMVQTK